MAKTLKKYKYNKYNNKPQTNKQVILHKIFYINMIKILKLFSGKIIQLQIKQKIKQYK